MPELSLVIILSYDNKVSNTIEYEAVFFKQGYLKVLYGCKITNKAHLHSSQYSDDGCAFRMDVGDQQ